MAAINYSELRNNLKEMMDRACNDHESLIVSRKNHADVVMLSLEDYESLKETAYLLRSPANAKRILASVESFRSGGGTEHPMIEEEE